MSKRTVIITYNLRESENVHDDNTVFITVNRSIPFEEHIKIARRMQPDVIIIKNEDGTVRTYAKLNNPCFESALKENKEMENKNERNENKDEMLTICVHCDDTGLYTEAECEDINLVDVELPKEIVREWFYAILKEFYRDITFEDWFLNVCTADEFDGITDFARERGFEVKRPDGKKFEAILAKEINERIVEGNESQEGYIESNLMEAAEVARQNGSLYDLDNMVHLKEILGFSVSYDFYHFVEEKLPDGTSMDLVDEDKQKILKWLYEYMDGCSGNCDGCKYKKWTGKLTGLGGEQIYTCVKH